MLQNLRTIPTVAWETTCCSPKDSSYETVQLMQVIRWCVLQLAQKLLLGCPAYWLMHGKHVNRRASPDLRCTVRICARPGASGSGTTTLRAMRPGRSSAGSSTSMRLVAARNSTPAIEKLGGQAYQFNVTPTRSSRSTFPRRGW